jgi:hypothetical protein
VAEGGGLLNRYTVISRIEGSNPSVSARSSAGQLMSSAWLRPFGFEFTHEGVEPGLRLQPGVRVVSVFRVRCMRSWRPLWCGWQGLMRSSRKPSLSQPFVLAPPRELAVTTST